MWLYSLLSYWIFFYGFDLWPLHCWNKSIYVIVKFYVYCKQINSNYGNGRAFRIITEFKWGFFLLNFCRNVRVKWRKINFGLSILWKLDFYTQTDSLYKISRVLSVWNFLPKISQPTSLLNGIILFLFKNNFQLQSSYKYFFDFWHNFNWNYLSQNYFFNWHKFPFELVFMYFFNFHLC